MNKYVFKPFLHIAPTELRIFVGCFSTNITLLRSLKALILLGFMKKPTLVSLLKGDGGVLVITRLFSQTSSWFYFCLFFGYKIIVSSAPIGIKIISTSHFPLRVALEDKHEICILPAFSGISLSKKTRRCSNIHFLAC